MDETDEGDLADSADLADLADSADPELQPDAREAGAPLTIGITTGITIGAAAARLGVAVPTLRSWERRYGLGPGPAHPGRHRRYSATDMAVLARFCHLVAEGVPTPDAARAALASDPTSTEPTSTDLTSPDPTSSGPAPRRPPAPIPHSARGLARSAIRLDAPQVLAVLESTIAEVGVVAAWEQTIKPALLAVSRKWTETDGRYVEVEHLLSWCVTVALHRVRPAADTSPAAAPNPSIPARPVLLACAPDEWHSLPLDVLHAALTQHSVPVRMLGAAVPADALRAAITRLRPARVVIWSQTTNTADPTALPTIAARPRTPCRVLPAGPGWPAARPAVPDILLSLPEALKACLPHDDGRGGGVGVGVGVGGN